MDWFALRKKRTLVTAEQALPDRDHEIQPRQQYTVFGRPITPPYAPKASIIYLGLGCFWGAERRFWQQPGITLTAVGYGGAHTHNATYEDVWSSNTGHV